MSDLLIGFQGEAKTFGDTLGPAEEDGFRRHAIETVIDFDGGKLLSVEGEHVLVRKFFWIEAAFPLFVGITGSTDAELASARNGNLRRSTSS